MSVREASLLLAVALVPLGCSAGGQIRASIGTYEAGNYNRAAHHCSEVADVEDELNEKAHVRYLVYCGLTSYRLGHRAEAQKLLTLGSQEYQQGRSRWLKPAIVDEMMKALDDLEGRAPPVPQSSTTVVSGGPDDEVETQEDPEKL
ncbi:MAG: hypothetical protein HOV80_00970 [Polyangiaceae bacterium]|nr:hypothetical protein [Polyangiaceae bacterium]